MRSNHSLTPRVLNPECARYAALLPVLDEAGTDPFSAAQARAHAAGCPRCHADLAAYDRLEGALRRHFAPEAAPRLSTADLLWGSTGLPLEDIMHNAPDATPSPTTSDTPDPPDRPASPPLPDLAARRPHGSRRLISAVAAIAAVLALAVTAQVLFAGSHGHTTGTIKSHATATATPVFPPFDQLSSIVAVSPTEAWAAGSGGTFTSQGTSSAYLLREVNGHWQPVPLSCRCQHGIAALSLVSPTDIWAVGWQGLVLHYDGHIWKQLASPTDPTGASGPDFIALDMVSAAEGWALDQSDTLWHYHAGAWAQVKAPTIAGVAQPYTLQLHGITMVTADEGWAVGEADSQIVTTSSGGTTSNPGPPTGVILHYVGGHWNVQGTWPNAIVHTIAMTSADDGWAGGESDQQVTYGLPTAIPPIPASTRTVATPLLLRYRHGSWQATANPVHSPDYSQGSLTAMAMFSAYDGWALESLSGSFSYNANAASVGNLLLRYHNGAWAEVQLPLVYNRDSAPVGAIAVTPQGDLWLVGSAWWPREAWVPAGNGGYAPKVTALILHFSQGKWTVVES